MTKPKKKKTNKKQLLASVMIIFASLIFMTALTSAFDWNGLSAYYNMDSGNDSLGMHNFSYIPIQNPPITTSVGCISGNCQNFSYEHIFVNGTDDNQIYDFSKKNISTHLWFKPYQNPNDAVLPALNEYIFAKRGTTDIYFVFLDSTTQFEAGRICTGGTQIKPMPELRIGEWNDFALVTNDTSAMFYFNGKQVFQCELGSFGGGTIGGDTLFELGGRHGDPDSYNFNGLIDENSWWNKALTPNDISFLYNTRDTYSSSSNPYLNWTGLKQIDNLSSYDIVQFNVPYVSGMNSDFSDIRFSDVSNLTEYPYWIENQTNSGQALIRVRSNQNPTIYMHYGNNIATSQSDIKRVLGQDLVSYWTFQNGNVDDLVNNNPMSNSTAIPIVNTPFGTGLYFNGDSDQYLVEQGTFPQGSEARTLFVSGLLNTSDRTDCGIIAEGQFGGTRQTFELVPHQVDNQMFHVSWGADGFIANYSPDQYTTFMEGIDKNGTISTGLIDGTPTSFDIGGQINTDNSLDIMKYSHTSTTCVGIVDEAGIYSQGLGLQTMTELDNMQPVTALFSNNLLVTDTEFPLFSGFSVIPENDTPFVNNTAFYFNVSIINTNGNAGMFFNGANYSMNNISSVYQKIFVDLAQGVYPYYFWAYGNGSSNNYNQTELYSYTVGSPLLYPTLFNLTDNSGQLIDNGTAIFNIDVNDSNGTVILELAGTNYTASNISNHFSVSTTLTNGTYQYKWFAYGIVGVNNYNQTSLQNYSVGSSFVPPVVENPVLSNPIYTIMNGAGAGITIFLQLILTVLPNLLLGLLLISVIVGIIWLIHSQLIAEVKRRL